MKLTKSTVVAGLVAAGIVCALAVGGFLYFQGDSRSSASPVTDPQFIGIANEAMGELERNDTANVFVASADGQGVVIHRLAPTYFPSVQRLGDGFVAPGEDSLVVFDSSLSEVGRHEITGLGVAVQTRASHSPAHESVAFSFNEGTADSPYRHRVVTMTSKGTHNIMTDQMPLFLTACDDGTAKWLEYFPDSGMEDPLGPGVASIITLGSNGDREAAKIEWYFANRPGPASVLQCGQNDSYVDSGSGDIIQVPASGHQANVSGKLPKYALADRGRFDHVAGEDYFALNSSGMLTRLNLPNGAIEYEQFVDFKGHNPVSVTFDSGKAYVVVQPPDGSAQQSLIIVDTSDPSCTSENIPLSGFDEAPSDAKVARQGNSFIVVDTIMALDPRFTIACADHQLP